MRSWGSSDLCGEDSAAVDQGRLPVQGRGAGSSGAAKGQEEARASGL